MPGSFPVHRPVIIEVPSAGAGFAAFVAAKLTDRLFCKKIGAFGLTENRYIRYWDVHPCNPTRRPDWQGVGQDEVAIGTLVLVTNRR